MRLQAILLVALEVEHHLVRVAILFVVEVETCLLLGRKLDNQTIALVCRLLARKLDISANNLHL